MPLPTKCYYLKGLPLDALATEMELFARDVLDRILIGRVDGANLSHNLFLPSGGVKWFPPPPGPNPVPKQIYIPLLTPSRSEPFIRLKGQTGANKHYGIEFCLDPSSSTYGKFCLVDLRDPDLLQRLSLSIDAWSDAAPGALIKTPTGVLTFDTGGAFDIVVKRNGVTGWTFGPSKSTTPFHIESTLATGTAPLIIASTTLVTNLNADLLDGFDSAYFATAASLGSYQPLDSDLTAIAAIATTAFGRALLALADAAAGRTAFSVYSVAEVNAGFAPLSGGYVPATYLSALTGDVTKPAGSAATTLAAGSASVLNSGTLPAGRLPALTGDVTSSAGSAATTLAAGSASNLNSGTLNAARMPALTGDVTTSAGAVATTIGANKVTLGMLATLADQKLIGNGSGGTATPTAVSIANSLTLTGGTLAAAKPKGFMYGLRGTYNSATVVDIGAGVCRDSTDAIDLSFEAASPDITTRASSGVNGIDDGNNGDFTATATTHGTNTFEPSASIWVETLMTATVRTLTGTISTVTTAATGVGTKFLSEMAIGDVLRSATKGASRVTAIASDTAATLVAALPGGNCTTEAATLYENLTIWPDKLVAGDKVRVNTITHAGTSVVVSAALTSSAAGKSMRPGVEVASCWYFPFVCQTAGGVIVVLSTQRTKPYITNTAFRRIPCALYNNASGHIDDFDDRYGGPIRLILWRFAGDHQILGGVGAPGGITLVPTTTACPATASTLVVTGIIFAGYWSVTAGYCVLQMMPARNTTTQISASVGVYLGNTAGTAGTIYSNGGLIAVESAGGLNYQTTGGGAGTLTGSPLYIFTEGWYEVAS